MSLKSEGGSIDLFDYSITQYTITHLAQCSIKSQIYALIFSISGIDWSYIYEFFTAEKYNPHQIWEDVCSACIMQFVNNIWKFLAQYPQ